MKILVATGSGGLEDNVSPTFGRCASYTIVEAGTEIRVVAIESNPYAGAAGGAGIQAAQYAVDKGVKAVIAGNFGPNASDVLTQAGIEMIAAGGNVKDVIERYLKGELEPAGGPTAPLHGGMGGVVSTGAGAGPGMGTGFGRRAGMGRGMGRGCGQGRRSIGLQGTLPAGIAGNGVLWDDRITLIEEKVEALSSDLAMVKNRLDELER